MSFLSLLTRGYIDDSDDPTLVDALSPELMTSEVEPIIEARNTSSPDFKITETVPDLKPVIRPRRRRR